MHKDTKNQSYVGLSGQTLTTNVPMTLCDSQIRHETHVLCGCTMFDSQINTVPTPTSFDKGVAYTGGGGGVDLFRISLYTPCVTMHGVGGGGSIVTPTPLA